MGKEKRDKKGPPIGNVISDETGQYDIRFLLWRQFCAENNVPVDTLPSELEVEIREKCEELKENRLHRPTENS